MNNDYPDFGQHLLDLTREYILQSIEKGVVVEEKNELEFKESEKKDPNFIKNFVTEIDRETEQILRNAILSKYPDHGIVGEEFGSYNANAEYIWYIDPIDGTSEFVKKSPYYGTVLSLYHKGGPILGMIDHPSLDLRSWASKGDGAFCNGKKILIEDVKDSLEISKELIAIGPRFMFARHDAESDYDNIVNVFQNTETIMSCYGHTKLLQGKLGGVVDYHLRIWDISPVKLLVEEAGGKFVEVKRIQRESEIMYAIMIGKPKVIDRILGLLD